MRTKEEEMQYYYNLESESMVYAGISRQNGNEHLAKSYDLDKEYFRKKCEELENA